VLVPFTSPYLWLAIATAGFALTVVRPDGLALDEKAVSYLRWRVRSATGGRTVTKSSDGPLARQGLVDLRSGQYLAVIRTGGTPVAYLPPVELARRFELFRALLRSVRGAFAFSVTSVPMDPEPVTPAPGSDLGRDVPARTGYAELVTLLCRRRSVRRISLVLATESLGREGLSDLEERVRTVSNHLAALGLRPVRLRNRALRDAVRCWGWPWARSAR
jgi:hypothetical protein